MKALTIWQPWASLIAIEAKPYEFRRWAPRTSQVNQRIAIHAGKRPVRHDEVLDLIYRLEHDGGKGTGLKVEPALELLQGLVANPGAVPLSSIVCTAFLGRARKASVLFGGDVADSDRIDHHMWAWPLTRVERLEPFVPASGSQGFWNWNEKAA